MWKLNVINKSILNVIPPIILGVIATFFQINNYSTLTTREALIINAIQYISSMWFGWVVSMFFSEEDFKEKQKRFAFSAYRRIKEIEDSIQRLIIRINAKKINNREYKNDIEAIKEIAINLKNTAKSSEADWLDIIGEEIKIINEIEKIEKKEFTPDKELHNKINRLLQKIPSPLKLQVDNLLSSDDRFYQTIQDLKSELKKGYIELEGFWDNSFEKDIFLIPIGSPIFIYVDDAEKRVGALIAHTKRGEKLGVIVNKSDISYHLFVEALIQSVNKSKIIGKYTKRGYVSKFGREERHYFKVIIEN